MCGIFGIVGEDSIVEKILSSLTRLEYRGYDSSGIAISDSDKKKILCFRSEGKLENLKKIIRIVHLEIGKKMNIFLSKNKNKKIIILDIPLLLENKINKKSDILVFVKSKKSDILKRIKKRKNFNTKLLSKFKNIQLPLDYKKKRSQFIIKNNFTKKSIMVSVNKIIKEIL